MQEHKNAALWDDRAGVIYISTQGITFKTKESKNSNFPFKQIHISGCINYMPISKTENTLIAMVSYKFSWLLGTTFLISTY